MLAATLLARGSLHATATVYSLGGGSIKPPYSGYVEGNTWTTAMFGRPTGMALDPSGTALFIADYTNNAIRLVSSVGDRVNSVTTTFANATNNGGLAGISRPLAVLVDSATNVYVLNQGTGNDGAVLHLSGVQMNSGVALVYPALASGLVNATAMAMDGNHNLYVTVGGNKVIRVVTNNVTIAVGTISQAGTSLQGIAVLDNGQLALTDAGNNGIWIMNPLTGTATKFTGFHGGGDTNGTAAFASFLTPEGISKAGNGMLVVADRGNNKVKLVDASGTVTLLYGVSSNLWVTGSGQFPGYYDGPGTPTKGSAEARQPYGVLVGPNGNVYVTEVYYNVLREVTGTGLTGPQPGYLPIFSAPQGIAFNPAGNLLYIADYANNAVEVLNLLNNQTTTLLTNRISHPASVLLDTTNNIYVLNQNAGTNGSLLEFDPYGNFIGTNLTGLQRPTALTMDATGNIFITELGGSIKLLSPTGVSSTLATINTNLVALKTNVQLQGIAIFDDGNLAVSDAANQVIWTVNPISKLVSKLTGQLGTNGATLGASGFAQLNQPQQLARAGNNQLVIADHGNSRLVLATRSGTITNVLVSTNSQIWLGGPADPAAGTTLAMTGPAGVAVSFSGVVFDSEPTNALLRGLTATVAAPPAPPPVVNLPYFAAPQGLAFDNSDNNLLIADYANNAIRLLDLNDNLTSTFLTQANGITNPAAVLLDTNDNVYVLNQGPPGNGYILEFDQNGNSLATNLTGLNQPTAFTMDGAGNIFIAELAGNIKVLTPAGTWNTILTISTNLVTLKTNVQLQGIATLDDGYLAVSDAGNQVIWTVNPITRLVARLTGQLGASGATLGTSNLARLNQPHQLARAGNDQLVIADSGNNRLVVATRSGTITNVLAATNSLVWYGHSTDPGAGILVGISGPSGVAVSAAGKVFDSEPTNELVRGLTATVAAPPASPPVANLPYFGAPHGLAFDSLDNFLFIADYARDAIQLLDLNDNSTSTFLDAADGVTNPAAVLLDTSDNVYVLNQGIAGNGYLQEFDIYGSDYGAIVTGLKWPTAFTMDGYGTLLVAEQSGNIRAFGAGLSNLVATITNANVSLQGIALFDDGTIAVSDAGNHVIWTVNPITKLVTKLTGVVGAKGVAVGVTNFATLNQPHQLVRVGGNQIVAADYGNHRLVLVQRNGTVVTNNTVYHLNASTANLWFGETGDPVTSASPKFEPMVLPFGVALGSGGELFATETYYDDIRGLTGTDLTSPTFNPGVPLPYFAAPQGLAFDNLNNAVFIADYANNAIQVLDLNDNSTSAFLSAADGILNPASVLVDTNNNVYVLNQNTGANGAILEFDPYGNFLSTNLTGLQQPTAFTMDGAGNLFITELAGKVKVLYPSGAWNTLVTISTNLVTLKTNVQLQGIAAFDDGTLAISDSGNQVIWTVNPITKLVAKLTGQLGTNGSTLGASNFAKLNQPHQLARAGNNQLIIADYGNNRLVTATRAGSITNVLVSTNSQIWLGRPTDPTAGGMVAMANPAGVAVSASGQVFDSEPADTLVRSLKATVTAPPASAPIVDVPFFAAPHGLAFDSVDNCLLIADYPNNAVQLLNLNNNTTTTFLTSDDGLANPASVLVDTNDNIYVLNQGTPGNGYIQEFDIDGNAYGSLVTGLNQPTAFTMDGYGTMFVTEQSGNIRAFGAGISNLVATITNANVSLQGVALFDDGTIAVSDASNHVIWNVNPITKLVTKLTGVLGTNGVAVGVSNFASLYRPQQLVRVGGNQIVAADDGNNRLVLIQRNGTIVTNNPLFHLNSSVGNIWFGEPGDPVASGTPKFVPMILPFGVALGNGGEIFATETYYDDIRGLTGTGLSSPSFNPGVPLSYYANPAGLALNSESTVLYVTDPTNNTVSALKLANNQTTVFLTSSNLLSRPVDVGTDGGDHVYVLNQGVGGNGFVLEFDRFGNLLYTNATGLPAPAAMTFDNSGNVLVAEQGGAVQEFAAGASNAVSTVATLTNAGVQLQGIALFDDGTIVVSDAGNHVIWQLDPVTKAASLFTGQLHSPGTTFGAPGFAQLNQPHQLKLAAGNLLVAADSGNNRLVVMDRSGSINYALNSTNATVWFGLPGDPAAGGTPEFVPMVSPIGVAIGVGGGVFASETYFHDVREILGTTLGQPSSGGGGGGTGTNAIVVTPPIISPNAGYYPMGQTILVQCPEPQVYYTTDGSDPTTNSLPVGMTNNVGYIQWFNTTKDLSSLRLRAFLEGTNSSVMVSGQAVAAAVIGVPSDFHPTLYAGVGSTVVIPVVCDLATNQQIESYQFRLEIAPQNDTTSPTPVILPLSIDPTNDFVPLVTAAQDGYVASNTVAPYSLGATNGLICFAVGSGTHILFHFYAVVELLEVQIPYTANVGDTYALNVLYPSATADAYNTPVSLTAMAPMTITVTNIPYTVGDSAATSRTWYNAGTFGDGGLDNSDVNQAFDAASGLRLPYEFSDVFNAMDAYPPDAAGFIGGDGQIRFLDWVTILERSLRLDPSDWAREWSPGGILVDYSTNLVEPHALAAPEAKASPKVNPSSPWYRQVLIGADSVSKVAPAATAYVPVYAQLADSSSLSGLQFRALVSPANGAPRLTAAPQLVLASGAANPFITQSYKAGETAFGWPLGSFNYLSRSSNFLGWISFPVPTNAVTGQTYQVSLLNADGAPNATNQYDFETRSATVAVNATAPPATICSDEWKIHFFGSTTNPAAADNADPDGDGVPNWMEFLAGTDPTSASSKFQLTGTASHVSKGQTGMQLNWLTAPGHAYAVQWNSNLSSGTWQTLTTISGNGYGTNCADVNPSTATRYYRLSVLP